MKELLRDSELLVEKQSIIEGSQEEARYERIFEEAYNNLQLKEEKQRTKVGEYNV